MTEIHAVPYYQYFKNVIFSGEIRIVEEILIPDSCNLDIIAILDESYIVQRSYDKVIWVEAYLIKKALSTKIVMIIKEIC